MQLANSTAGQGVEGGPGAGPGGGHSGGGTTVDGEVVDPILGRGSTREHHLYIATEVAMMRC